eukprot:7853183-Pyramimonas_sp.AAC.1
MDGCTERAHGRNLNTRTVLGNGVMASCRLGSGAKLYLIYLNAGFPCTFTRPCASYHTASPAPLQGPMHLMKYIGVY